jgi:hypothetical protein
VRLPAVDRNGVQRLVGLAVPTTVKFGAVAVRQLENTSGAVPVSLANAASGRSRSSRT